MSPFYLGCLFLMASAAVLRDKNDFVVTLFNSFNCEHNNFHISPSIFSAHIPIHYLCFNKQLLPIPTCTSFFQCSFLLLLAGDVATNPGPTNFESMSARLGTLNVRSLRQKSAPLADILTSKSIDILAITETWLKPNDTLSCLADLTPSGYILRHQPRSSRRGGGVGLLVSDAFSVEDYPLPSYSTFEIFGIKITSKFFTGLVFSVYHPEPYHKEAFFDEMGDLFEALVSFSGEIYLMGDLNLHLDTKNAETDKFNEILTLFDYKQHVNFATHIHGHWLDVLITRSTNSFIKSVYPSPGISDHFLILADLNLIKTASQKMRITYRQYKKISLEKFKADIAVSELILEPKVSLSGLCDQYFKTLSILLDKHAPLKTKLLSDKPPTPWMTQEILNLKSMRRRLERRWRRTRSRYDRSKYTAMCQLCNRKMSKAKQNFLTSMIDNNLNNPRKLWQSVNKLLHRTPKPSLPNNCPDHLLPEKFSKFFVEKISKIRETFVKDQHKNEINSPLQCRANLGSLQPATPDEVRHIILSSSNASCSLDPIPTFLVKECSSILIKTITDIVNKSLSSGIFPDQFRTAHVTPLLKKPNLEKNDFKNYRPVSNLSFLSKVIEKIVAQRLSSYLENNSLTNKFQSAYRKFHSTESALIRVQNDILLSMDRSEVTALVLLDLSAAFDTIDHEILLSRLSSLFGVTGLALDWFKSYLSERFQQIKINHYLSKPASLKFGVPQGSVLGPILFTLYTSPLSNVISQSNISHHLYADDTQLYMSFSSNNVSDSLDTLSSCVCDVSNWMNFSMLKLNPTKTEFLIIGSQKQRSKFANFFPLELLKNKVTPAATARNLGVIFNNNLNYKEHISQVCKVCFYHIRDLRRIRKYINLNTAKTLASALIYSRLDYCNSLLYNISGSQISKLQRVQNSLARAISKSSRFSSSKPILKRLHWLPVPFRIKHKLCTLVFKSHILNKPSYMSELLKPLPNSCNLRSSNTNKLHVPRVRTQWGGRSFGVAGPALWNLLPPAIRNTKSLSSFKKLLKTHFFGEAFPT